MDSEEDDLAALGVLLVMAQENRKTNTKKRKQWCKKWLLRRNKSSDVQLLREISDEEKDFQNYYLRMSENVYQKLLSLVSPFIKKKDTIMPSAISPHERVLLRKHSVRNVTKSKVFPSHVAFCPFCLNLIV